MPLESPALPELLSGLVDQRRWQVQQGDQELSDAAATAAAAATGAAVAADEAAVAASLRSQIWVKKKKKQLDFQVLSKQGTKSQPNYS